MMKISSRRTSASMRAQGPKEHQPSPRTVEFSPVHPLVDRRYIAGGMLALALSTCMVTAAPAALAADGGPPPFVRTPSGLLIQDIKEGTGPMPRVGDTAVIDWSGRLKNYQSKTFGNSTKKDGEPFEFKIGSGAAIKAVDEAVLGMKVGGIRRVEVPGELSELSYPRDKAQRYIGGAEGTYKYRVGPPPQGIDGQRSLDFLLNNDTLAATNRALLFDIRLDSIRPARQ